MLRAQQNQVENELFVYVDRMNVFSTSSSECFYFRLFSYI